MYLLLDWEVYVLWALTKLLYVLLMCGCRYLVANKVESRQRRREVGKLKKKLADLEKRLNR